MYCLNCGKQLPEHTKFCMECGTAMPQTNNGVHTAPNYQSQNGYNPNFAYQTPPYGYQNAYNTAPPPNSYAYTPPAPKNIVQILSNKMQINGIIWLVIGILQCFLSLYYFINSPYVEGYPIFGTVTAVIAVSNIIHSTKDMNYSKTVLSHPYDIVKKFTPLSGAVATLVYNLLFGGIVGVAGSIYYFTIRSFVMNNQGQFSKIEREFLERR